MTTEIIQLAIWTAVLITTIYLMTKEKSKVLKGQISEERLSGKNKAIIWILCFLNPVLAGAIFYYGWRKNLPNKAKKANQISLWAFFILFIFSIAFLFFINYSNSKISQEYIDKYNEISSIEEDVILASSLDLGDKLQKTQDLNKQVQILNDAILTRNDAISKLDVVASKANELRKLANDISDSALRNDALNLVGLLEKMNATGKNLFGLQKEIINELLAYSNSMANGENIDLPININDLEIQINTTIAEFQTDIEKYIDARDEFGKKAGLILEKK